MDDPDENCLRIELHRNECVGDPTQDFPMAYTGVSSAVVGKALTECITEMKLMQLTVYKLETIPGC